MEDLSARDDRGRSKIGIDLRSVCDDLYRTQFRFVQRHPPEVVIPSCTDQRFNLLLAATFGHLPESGPLADVSDVYLKALDGKRVKVKPVEFPKFFSQKYLLSSPCGVSRDRHFQKQLVYRLEAVFHG